MAPGGGEITPDYQDVLFKKGFGGILREAEEHIGRSGHATDPEDEDKRDFYDSRLLDFPGHHPLANRYADEAEAMAEARRRTLSGPRSCADRPTTAAACPEHPPEAFYEATQFVWFVQLGGHFVRKSRCR